MALICCKAEAPRPTSGQASKPRVAVQLQQPKNHPAHTQAQPEAISVLRNLLLQIHHIHPPALQLNTFPLYSNSYPSHPPSQATTTRSLSSIASSYSETIINARSIPGKNHPDSTRDFHLKGCVCAFPHIYVGQTCAQSYQWQARPENTSSAHNQQQLDKHPHKLCALQS